EALPGGSIYLWSCRTASGADGASFVRDLSRTIGAPVAAATDVVGAQALGGRWDLDAREGQADDPLPLTAEGVAAYPAVLQTKTWNVTTGSWNTPGDWSPVGVPVDGDDVVINGTGDTVNLDVDTANLNSLNLAAGDTLNLGGFTLNAPGKTIG